MMHGTFHTSTDGRVLVVVRTSGPIQTGGLLQPVHAHQSLTIVSDRLDALLDLRHCPPPHHSAPPFKRHKPAPRAHSRAQGFGGAPRIPGYRTRTA